MTRGSSSPAPVLPPDDVIREILLRLPPHPACLLRAALVCKHWRRLVRDAAFLCRLRARHRHKPPLLGFFDRLASFAPPVNRPTV
uniref:F-box domain-containing protein n=1 Tax=Arundo donax TaxID=35708 RepID=A0A0A8ZXI3_ARUDO